MARMLNWPMAIITLVISGNDVVLCDGEMLIDVVRRAGQGVLNVLPLGGVKEGLDAELVAMARPDTSVAEVPASRVANG